MNKIFYTLFFILFFSFLNNNAKAQTSPDVSPCTTNASGAVVITTQIASTTDQTCDTSGATNLTLNIHSLGFCTSAPTVRFVDGGKAVDERDRSIDSYSDGASDFSSCRWVITQSTPSPESLESVGAIEPLPNDEIPPAGTYTHAVLVISNEMTLTGSVTFSQTIKDTTGTGINGNSGLTCWTNGTYFVDTGKQGPLIGTDVTDAATNKTAGIYKGGATCGDTASPTANTIVSYYSNYEPAVSTGEACASAVTGAGARTAGCNTTRSEESTSFGNLTVLFTKASNLGTTNPTIQRSKIVTTTVDGKAHGTATDTNTLTAIFAYNTPMTVTDKTTGMEIFINFKNALSLDFEPSGVVISAVKNTITNISPGVTYTPETGSSTTDTTSAPRIRAIQSGPFGIQFRSVEGGGTN